MKLSDILKKIGINLDEEIEYADEKTLISDNKSNKEVTDDKKVEDKVASKDTKETKVDTKETKVDTKETSEDTKETQEEIKVELKFDDKTGLFDLKGIEDADIKAVLQRANDYTVKTANNVKIEKAFNEKLSGLKIRKGITNEVIKKMINFDDVKVDGDKVIGLDEAFETLQKEQSGLFVTRQQSESNPMLEGFNPVQNNDSSSALNASLASLAASLGGNN
jgi:hypothetical protein